MKVFDDPNFVLVEDRIDAETGELRWHAISAVPIDDGGAVLLVAHVYRSNSDNGEEIIRLISARRAKKRERRSYFQ